MKGRIVGTVVIALALSTSVFGATQAQIDRAWNRGLAWLMTNQHGDGGWSSAPGLGVQATGSALQALANVNLKGGYTFLGGVSWLGNAEAVSVDALARQAAGLKAANENVAVFAAKLAGWRNTRKAWGAYPRYGSGLPDTPLGITTLMDAQGTAYGNNDIAAAVCQFLPAQLPGPGYLWPYALTTGTAVPAGQRSGAITPTVSAVQALNKVNTTAGRFTAVTCGSVTYTFTSVINNAVTGLLATRKADHGFGDGAASTVLETALVYQVLKALRPADAATGPALDYLIARQAADGSWSADALHTAVVLSSLPAPTALVDTDNDGIPDGVETILGTNPAVPDSRFLALGAGAAATTMQALAEPIDQPAMMVSLAGTEALAVSTAGPTSPAGAGSVEEATPQESPTSPFAGKTVDIEVLIAGASAAASVLDAALLEFFAYGPEAILYDDGGAPGSVRGDTCRAYLGVIGDPGPVALQGKRALVHFSGTGGSFSGVAPVARAAMVERMAVDERCTDPDGDGWWSCPADHTVPAIPDAGISEAQPALHVGANVPAGETPLTDEELAALDAAPVYRGIYGAAVTGALKDAGLTNISRVDLARLLTGAVADSWAALDAMLPQQPIIICRMADGAGPAANALFLDIPCHPGAATPLPQSSSLNGASGTLTSPGCLVVENGTSGAAVDCLNRAGRGDTFTLGEAGPQVAAPAGGLALAVLPMERQPNAAETWGYISIDNASCEGKSDAISGAYPFVMDAWMQWRKRAGSMDAPGEDKLALLETLRHRLADPDVLRLSLVAIPLGDSPPGDACRTPAGSP